MPDVLGQLECYREEKILTTAVVCLGIPQEVRECVMVSDKNTMLPLPNTILFGVFCCALTVRGGTAKEK